MKNYCLSEVPIELGLFLLAKSDSLIQGTEPPSYTTLLLGFLWPWSSFCLSHDCSLIVLPHDSTTSFHPRVCSWSSSLSCSTYSFKDPTYTRQILCSMLMILNHFSLAHLSPSMYFWVFHRHLRLREPKLQLILSSADLSYLCQVSSSSIIFYSAIFLGAKIWVPSGFLKFLPLYFTCKLPWSSLPYAWLILSKYCWMNGCLLGLFLFIHSVITTFIYIVLTLCSFWQLWLDNGFPSFRPILRALQTNLPETSFLWELLQFIFWVGSAFKWLTLKRYKRNLFWNLKELIQYHLFCLSEFLNLLKFLLLLR